MSDLPNASDICIHIQIRDSKSILRKMKFSFSGQNEVYQRVTIDCRLCGWPAHV